MKTFDQFELNTYLFLLLIKVVDDHSNKQIQGEEGANNDEEDKEEVHVDVDFFYGLLSQLEDIKEIMQDLLVESFGTFFLMTKTRIFLGIAWFFLMKTRRYKWNEKQEIRYLAWIYSIVHDRYPAFESGHLKQGQVGLSHMVKIDARVHPTVITFNACNLVRDHFRIKTISLRVHTLNQGEMKNKTEKQQKKHKTGGSKIININTKTGKFHHACFQCKKGAEWVKSNYIKRKREHWILALFNGAAIAHSGNFRKISEKTNSSKLMQYRGLRREWF